MQVSTGPLRSPHEKYHPRSATVDLGVTFKFKYSSQERIIRYYHVNIRLSKNWMWCIPKVPIVTNSDHILVKWCLPHFVYQFELTMVVWWTVVAKTYPKTAQARFTSITPIVSIISAAEISAGNHPDSWDRSSDLTSEVEYSRNHTHVVTFDQNFTKEK